MKKIIFGLIGLLLLVAPSVSNAACGGSSPNRTAANATQAEVSACLSVAVNGDTITVPAGSAAWTSVLPTINNHINLIGSGGVTITDNTLGGDPDAGGGPSLITINESTAGNTKIQGFTFIQGTGVHTGKGGIIQFTFVTSGKPVLITGNAFVLGINGNSIVANSNRGVIWSNAFTGARGDPNCLSNASMLRHKVTVIETSWTTPSTFGAADTNGELQLYFETNTSLNIAEAIDTDDNGRTVVRYNTITNGGITLHGVDTSGRFGARSIEVYNNTFVKDLTPIAACANEPANVNSYIHVRGGTALIHDNIIPDPSNPTWGPKSAVTFTVEELRRNAGGFPCWSTTTAPGAGYPSVHNAGWGYITGATVRNGTNCPNCPVSQDIEPIYLWNNTSDGNYATPLVPDYVPNECGGSAPSAATYVVSGRDYFTNTAKPGYTAFTYPHPLAGGSPPPPPPPPPASSPPDEELMGGTSGVSDPPAWGRHKRKKF